MEVKNIRLDDNRGGVLAVAYTNGTDTTPDKIKGGWFSGFNSNVTRRSTNRAGNDVGITGKELLNGAKTLGGSWVANSKVDYEYRVFEEIGPQTCFHYEQLKDVPYELMQVIRNNLDGKDKQWYSSRYSIKGIDEFMSFIRSGGGWTHDESNEYITKDARYDFSKEHLGIRWRAYEQVADINLCIQKIYTVTPTERTLKETRITKLTYVLFRGVLVEHIPRETDSNGVIHVATDEYHYFKDVLTGEIRMLDTKRRILHVR